MNIPELTEQEKSNNRNKVQILINRIHMDTAQSHDVDYANVLCQWIDWATIYDKLVKDINAKLIISSDEKIKAEQKIDQLNREIGALDVELKTAQAKAEQFEKRATAAEARLQNPVAQPVQNVRNTPEYQELQKRLTTAVNERDAKDKTIAELNGQLQTAQQDLQSERDKAKKELEQAQLNASTKDSNIVKAEAAERAAKDAQAKAESQLAELQALNAELQAFKEKALEKLKDMQQQIDKASARRQEERDKKAMREMNAATVGGSRSIPPLPGNSYSGDAFSRKPKSDDGLDELLKLADAIDKNQASGIPSHVAPRPTTQELQSQVFDDPGLAAAALNSGMQPTQPDPETARELEQLRQKVATLEHQLKDAQNANAVSNTLQSQPVPAPQDNSAELEQLRKQVNDDKLLIERLKKQVAGVAELQTQLDVAKQKVASYEDAERQAELQRQAEAKRQREEEERRQREAEEQRQREEEERRKREAEEQRKREEEERRNRLPEGVRISTDPETLKQYKNLKFMDVTSDLTGVMHISSATARRAKLVVIDGKAYPNPMLFAESLKGNVASSQLELLWTVFDPQPQKPSSNAQVKLLDMIPAQLNIGDPVTLTAKGSLTLE